MATIHSVEISWEDLLGAFTSGQHDKAYYLDRLTGEIFSVPSTSDNNEVRQQLKKNGERFLEIPPFDYRSERQIVTEFVAQISDIELRNLLHASLAGKKPFGKIEDILSFYPQEEERFALLKDQFLSKRLKTWMEENNLFTADAILQGIKHASEAKWSTLTTLILRATITAVLLRRSCFSVCWQQPDTHCSTQFHAFCFPGSLPTFLTLYSSAPNCVA